jgi:hypothetical protein
VRSAFTLSVALLVGAAGCLPSAARNQPQPDVPAVSDVANIHLTSIGSSLGQAYDVTLTREQDVAVLLDWLRQIDWSPSRAHDLRNVGLAPVGKITISLKDGTSQSFDLSGGSIIVNHWEWPADTDRLAEIARQAGAPAP